MTAATRGPSTTGALGVSDRSGTLPLCPDCEYRTLAIDLTRGACRHCGQIIASTGRTRRHLAAVFGGTIAIEVEHGRDRS